MRERDRRRKECAYDLAVLFIKLYLVINFVFSMFYTKKMLFSMFYLKSSI